MSEQETERLLDAAQTTVEQAEEALAVARDARRRIAVRAQREGWSLARIGERFGGMAKTGVKKILDSAG